MRVLYTGATGRMGEMIRAELVGCFGESKLFCRTTPAQIYRGEVVTFGDLADLSTVVEATEGVDVVIHLGAVSDEAPFDLILEANIRGTYNVFEAARRNGVGRVVYASSNHVTGFHPTTAKLDARSEVRPDSHYGVSKVFGEALGRLYFDKWGIEVVVLRIGACRPVPEDERQLSMWLSPRDAGQLVYRAAVAPDVGFVTVYGVSRNSRGWWSLEEARKILGYDPVDDAEDYAARIDIGQSPVALQGGAFTHSDYRGGLWWSASDADEEKR